MLQPKIMNRMIKIITYSSLKIIDEVIIMGYLNLTHIINTIINKIKFYFIIKRIETNLVRCWVQGSFMIFSQTSQRLLNMFSNLIQGWHLSTDLPVAPDQHIERFHLVRHHVCSLRLLEWMTTQNSFSNLFIKE